MRVMNNTSAMAALGELKRNDSDFKKQLKKVASGMKINSAGDGASQYSISERMRVRLRSLGQDEQNVQTGASLLHTAEGGIQNQIEILKTIKQKVIDANNDTNTDLDRATIQKEIDQSYDQMQDIAIDTNYNGRRVLFGGTENEKVAIWEVKNKAELVPDSDKMEVIPDKYATLDGITGPFDIFTEYGESSSTIPLLNLASTQKFSGATDGTPSTFSLDFSNYASTDDLNGVGINFGGNVYVLTKDTSLHYRTGNNKTSSYYTTDPSEIPAGRKIDISSCATVGDVVKQLEGTSVSGFKLTANGQSLTAVTTAKGASTKSTTLQGVNLYGGDYKYTTPAKEKRDEVPATGVMNPSLQRLKGGTDPSGDPSHTGADYKPYVPGTKASLTVDLSGAAAGTGFTVQGSGATYIKFVSGSSGLTPLNSNTSLYSLGVDANVTTSINGMTMSYANGKLTLTANRAGRSPYNFYYVKDGIEKQDPVASTTTTTTYTTGKAYNGTKTLVTAGTDGTPATYPIDLTQIPETTSSDDLATVIQGLRGKCIYYDGSGYEFIDSADTMSLASQTMTSSTAIDLNALRSAVSGGTTVREALASLLESKLSNVDTASSTKDKVVVKSLYFGSTGNNDTLSVKKGNFGSYDIDYGAWFQKNASATIPDDLYDKGFHFYCATDASQWFNIIFTNGDPYEKDRPASGTDTEDIKTMQVDVSKVKTASDLVTAIYEQTMPYLTGSDPNYNHFYRIAAQKDTGVLTIYDSRPYRVNNPRIYNYQEKGAKIADGIMDNVIKSTKDMLVDRVIIQHTDHADQNIRLNLPRTTLDQVFQFIVGKQTVSDYNVMTKAMREKLLGNPPATQGILDKGIQYLTDANTIIGAQTNHLSFAYSNIKTQQESTQSSESTIRDADMAKEMVNYTKSNILAQTAQSMLAQANQNASSVMNLLQ